MQRIHFAFVICAMATSGIAVAQVHKCSVNGVTVYQQRPCVDTGTTGSAMVIRGSGTSSLVEPRANDSVKPSDTTKSPSVPEPRPLQSTKEAAISTKSPLENEADQCLEWYRPYLRDPRGAYFKDPRKDGRVMTMTIHATNGYGGYVTREASCEFKGNTMDVEWTKIHAKRLGWGA